MERAQRACYASEQGAEPKRRPKAESAGPRVRGAQQTRASKPAGSICYEPYYIL